MGDCHPGWRPGDSLKLQALPPEQPQTLSLQEALQQAISHHRAGQLQDAEQLYRAILEVAPQRPDASHNLGVLALEVNKPEAALVFENCTRCESGAGAVLVELYRCLDPLQEV